MQAYVCVWSGRALICLRSLNLVTPRPFKLVYRQIIRLSISAVYFKNNRKYTLFNFFLQYVEPSDDLDDYKSQMDPAYKNDAFRQKTSMTAVPLQPAMELTR